MAMRHISEVLADIMCDIEAKRAANGPHEFDGDHRNRLEGKAGDPRAQTDRENGCAIAQPEGVASERKMAPKPGVGEAPGPVNGQRRAGGVTRLSTHGGSAVELVLVVNNKDMGRASPTRTPRAARPISLVLVSGGHAALRSMTGTSIRSRNS